MSRFVNAEETDEIRAPWWAEGETVTIRRLSWADRLYIQKRSTVVGAENGDGTRSVLVDLEAFDLALMERGIVAWTLRAPPVEGHGGEEAGIAPLTVEMFGRLTAEDGQFISDAINALNPRRSATEQAGFRAGAGDGAAE